MTESTTSPVLADSLRAEAAAAYIDRSMPTLRKYTAEGRIGSFRYGGVRYWPRSSLDAFLAAQRHASR